MSTFAFGIQATSQFIWRDFRLKLAPDGSVSPLTFINAPRLVTLISRVPSKKGVATVRAFSHLRRPSVVETGSLCSGQEVAGPFPKHATAGRLNSTTGRIAILLAS